MSNVIQALVGITLTKISSSEYITDFGDGYKIVHNNKGWDILQGPERTRIRGGRYNLDVIASMIYSYHYCGKLVGAKWHYLRDLLIVRRGTSQNKNYRAYGDMEDIEAAKLQLLRAGLKHVNYSIRTETKTENLERLRIYRSRITEALGRL